MDPTDAKILMKQKLREQQRADCFSETEKRKRVIRNNYEADINRVQGKAKIAENWIILSKRKWATSSCSAAN